MSTLAEMDAAKLLAGMEDSVEQVERRLARVTDALDKSGIPYAVIGGNAVRAWVWTVDYRAMRTTRDVDILLDRENLEMATRLLTELGFIFRQSAGMTMFLDGEGTRAIDAVHVLFAGEKVRESDPCPAPSVADVERPRAFRVLKLEPLVRMKLVAFRRKDQTHLVDLINLKLIDDSWLTRFPPELASRLQELLDDENERPLFKPHDE